MNRTLILNYFGYLKQCFSAYEQERRMEHLGTIVEQKQFLYNNNNNPVNALINIFNLQYGK